MGKKEEQNSVVSRDYKNTKCNSNSFDNESHTHHTAGEVLEGHRKISKEITKNRGLVPERKKKFKNPRVRSKYRAEKQSNKVKNQIKPIIKPLHKYRGEKSKIRTDIVRSIPMRT